MLRHSTRLLTSHQRFLHLSRITNQVTTKAVSDEKEKKISAAVSIQEKVMNASNVALSKYNEIVGFTEIEQAYQKVTDLQVRNHSFMKKP